MKNRKAALAIALILCLTIMLSLSASARNPRSITPVIGDFSVTPLEGGRIKVSVTTSGNPYPVYQWMTMNEGGELVPIPGAVGSVMTLKGYTPGETYSFQVFVTAKGCAGMAASGFVSVVAK